MPSKLHEEQSLKAAAWLRRNGFSVVATNIGAHYSREKIDCVGFRATCSVLIESKISRADFFADRKKPERGSMGVGLYRFYITPPGLVTIDELPGGWGLLHYDGRRVTMVHGPQGNYWPSFDTEHESWDPFKHKVNEDADRGILFSIARRLSMGKSVLT
jgi:hypothetical protein